MPDPERLWQSLVEEAGEDAIADAAAVTVTQAERDLTAVGFDVKEERARASARIAKLTGESATANGAHDAALDSAAWVSQPTSTARRRSSSRRVVWLAAALVAAAAAGGVLYALGRRSTPPERPVEPPREAPSGALPVPPVTREVPRTPLPPGPEKPTGPRGDPKGQR
jgi:hypothetical protein